MAGEGCVVAVPVRWVIARQRPIESNTGLEGAAGLEVDLAVMVARLAVESHVLDAVLGGAVQVIKVHVAVPASGVCRDRS